MLKKLVSQTITKISTGSANNYMQDKQIGKTRELEVVDSPVPSQSAERSISLHGDNREPVLPPDYDALQRFLQEASQVGYDELHFKAERLKSQIPPLIIKEKGNFSPNIRRDENSQKRIPTSKLKGEYVALHTTGDGNCFFRAASILAYGNEDKHREMRVRIVVDLLCNRSYYLDVPYIEERIRAQELYIQGKSSHKGRGKGQGELNKPVLEVAFEEEVRETCKDATWASDWHIQALATVLRRPLKIVFSEGIRALEMYFDDDIHPCDGQSMLDPLVILWTSTGPLENTGLNHFVPLVPADEIHSLGKALVPSENIGEPVVPCDSFIEKRRSSLPCDLCERKSKTPIQYCSSDSNLSKMGKDKELKLADPLGKSVLNNLDLLERLASFLDKEDPCHNLKCWKNLAEHFGVKASTYETFTCSPRSPTEKLFAHLESRDAKDFTIAKLKSGLHAIDRGDIINILEKRQESDSSLTDETPVDTLFQTWPYVFDDITRLLDVVKPGVNNWRQLAGKLGVPNTEHQNFEESDDPAMTMFEYLMVTDPGLTVGCLKAKLQDLGMNKAWEIISSLTETNSLEEFFDNDLDAVTELCNVLNQRHTRLIRRWRRLGNKLGIKKTVLDSFALHEREIISPTHALINHLNASQSFRTMQDLIWALDSIGRPDALLVVNNYFPVGCVQMFLSQMKQASEVLSHETP